MTLASWLLLKLAGGADARRERELAEAGRAADQALLRQDLAADETELAAQMRSLANVPHVLVGTTLSGVPYRIALNDLTSLPAWVTAGTGSGKSRVVGAMMDQIVQHLVTGAAVSLVVVDGKGETADQLLRSTAHRAQRLPVTQRATLLKQLHTFRFFDTTYLPSWPLLVTDPNVPTDTHADAIADVLMEVATSDAAVGPRQRSTLSALLALALEFNIPVITLPWLLSAPAEVATLAKRSSIPSVRLDLSRIERETSTSLDGLIARLGILLRVPAIKAGLSGEQPFDFRVCFEPGSVTTLSFGGADLGARSAVRAMGSLVISALANAAFDPRRRVRGTTIIVIDEPQAFLTSVSLGQFERLLTLGRSFGACGLVFVHQGPTQLPHEFRSMLSTNAPLRILGRSARDDAMAASEWLPRTGLVPQPRTPGVRRQVGSRFLSEGQEERFRIAEVGRLPPRHFLVSDRRTSFLPRVVRSPEYNPPEWTEIDPGVADAVKRGTAGVLRATLEARVRQIEGEAAAGLEAALRNEEPKGRRRGRVPETPDAFVQATNGKRGLVP